MPAENLSGRTIARYRLLERVGEGGTATVYKAEHPERGPAAVKILKERMRNDATAVKRFLREAGYGSRVQHPAVVRTFDYGEDGQLYYLALEWATGASLADIVHREGRIAPTDVAHIVKELAGGLSAAHAVGIIHRDLKPENIMYDAASRTVKLLDFGIARDAQMDASERLTRTGFFVGSLNYVAPEALSGELVNEAADIYSVATITYYLLTGRHPYSGSSPRQLFQQLLTEPPTPLNQAVRGLRFSRRLEEAVMRGLAREPAARQATVEQFAAAVGAAVGDAPAPEPQPLSAAAEGARRGGVLGFFRSLFGGA